MTCFSRLASAQAKDVAYTAVLDDIRARRDEFSALRHVPVDVVRKLQKIGAYRAFVPERFGGAAMSPAEFCRLIEDISAADASTGWVASFGVSATYLAALPPATYAAIYGTDPDTVFAGGIFPPQPATKVPGGFRVNGRWPYCSGVMGASVVGAGIKVEGDTTPLPRMAVMPRDKIRVEEVWDTIGLTASGSHDVVVEDVVVDPDWTFIRGGAAQLDDAIFRFPAMALAAQVLAVVSLGAAREALDFLMTDARGRASITGAPNPGTRPYVQIDFAKAEGLLMGARAAFYDTIEAGWDELTTTGDVSPEMKVRLRLVATKAARDGAEVARMAFAIGGTAVMMRGHTLGRCMVDAACVAQHAFMGEGTWTAAGAAFFDQPCMPGYP